MQPRSLLTGVKALGIALLSATASAAVMAPHERADVDATSLALLTKGADAQVQTVLNGKAAALLGSPRSLTRELRRLVTPFAWSDSAYHHDESLVEHMEEMLAVLTKRQHCDGTFSVGNRHSPPDTGFLIEDFGIMTRILGKDDHNASPGLMKSIRAILEKAAPGLAKGGIHTPNHRWKICGALARISRITEDESLITRVDEWLAEGVDIDADGIYSERSPIYYSEVTNPSLLTVAHELNRTELITYVRKNLELVIGHSEPSGEIETIQSRRQDQDQSPRFLRSFYPQFRELALLDNNGRFTAMARLIEKKFGAELGDYLGTLMERPELAANLPKAQEPFKDFDKHYSAVGLVRSRRGKLSASIFGGTDWYNADGGKTDFYNRFSSGLSTNPTMFRAWNGAAVLEAVRLVPNFFTMGHFRSRGITYDGDGAAKLGDNVEIPYYLPMAPENRDENGTYALSRSVDGRFHAMLDFENRPTSMRRLKTDVAVQPTETGYDLTFEVTGERDVELTLELTFRAGGKFQGVEELVDEEGEKTYQLIEGSGTYSLGDDTITFGPGNGEGLIQAAAGEQYSWHGGSLNLLGEKVYITGTSPLKYTLKLGFS